MSQSDARHLQATEAASLEHNAALHSAGDQPIQQQLAEQQPPRQDNVQQLTDASHESCAPSIRGDASQPDIAAASASTLASQWPRLSSNGNAPRVCRICLADCDFDDPLDPLISPCACKGSAAWVHRLCLRTWRKTGRNASMVCPVCNSEYERDALATVSCSSIGSSQDLLQGAQGSRLAAVALLNLQQRLAAQQRLSQGADPANYGFALDLGAAANTHAPPTPSWVQSILGPLGILLVIALLVGWVRGESDIVEWLGGTFIATVAMCCSPIAILHVALPAVVDAAAGSLGGRPGDYTMVEAPLTVLAWILMTAVVGTALLLSVAVGQMRAIPFRATVSALAYPATCYNHYQVIKQRREQWEQQQRDVQAAALEEQLGAINDAAQLQLWQQRLSLSSQSRRGQDRGQRRAEDEAGLGAEGEARGLLEGDAGREDLQRESSPAALLEGRWEAGRAAGGDAPGSGDDAARVDAGGGAPGALARASAPGVPGRADGDGARARGPLVRNDDAGPGEEAGQGGEGLSRQPIRRSLAAHLATAWRAAGGGGAGTAAGQPEGHRPSGGPRARSVLDVAWGSEPEGEDLVSTRSTGPVGTQPPVAHLGVALARAQRARLLVLDSSSGGGLARNGMASGAGAALRGAGEAAAADVEAHRVPPLPGRLTGENAVALVTQHRRLLEQMRRQLDLAPAPQHRAYWSRGATQAADGLGEQAGENIQGASSRLQDVGRVDRQHNGALQSLRQGAPAEAPAALPTQGGTDERERAPLLSNSLLTPH